MTGEVMTLRQQISGMGAGLSATVDRMAEMVRTLGQRLDDTQHDFPRMHTTMRDLERLLLRSEKEAERFEQLMNDFSEHELRRLNNLYCLWETKLEKRFVDHLQQDVVKHFVDYPLYARFERLIEREVSLLDGYVPKRVLFIGSGPMPITALCLQHRLDVNIDCLERSPEAIEHSNVVLNKLGFTNHIRVLQGFGEQIDASEYDVILIALLAKPKRTILENLLHTAPAHVRIICRTSEGSRCVFYEPTTLYSIPPALRVIKAASAGIDDTISSVLLRRIQN